MSKVLKTAVFTCGRLQPPGKGHKELIEAVYDIADEMDGDPFVWVSPSHQEIFPDQPPQKDGKNPISTLDKLHYLNKMYPVKLFGNLTFLTARSNLDVAFRQKIELKDDFTPKKSDFGRLKLCQWKKWKDETGGRRKGEWKTQKRIRNIRERDRRILEPTGRFVPSKAVIMWLIGKKYNNIHIRVGSDRISGFIKWNLTFLQSLKKKGLIEDFSIGQVGKNRGLAGLGKLFLPDESSGSEFDDSDFDLDKDVEYEDSKRQSSSLRQSTPDLLYSGENLPEGGGESKHSDSDDSDYDPLEEIEENEGSMAGKVSGTQMRHYACHFEEPDTDIADFIKLSKIGNMTIIDIFCLVNDIRVGSLYTSISWNQFWSKVKNIYNGRKQAKNKENISLTQFIDEIKIYERAQKSEYGRIFQELLSSDTRELPDVYPFQVQTPAPKLKYEKEVPLFSTSGKYNIEGGRKRKTRKRRKKKRRKKTRKMKERIIKFMRGPGEKKYTARIMHKKTRKIRHIHFGAKGYEQFKDSTPLGLYSSKNHGTKKRRDNYFSRHSGIKNKKKALAKEIRKSKGLYNAKILSHKYLW